MSALAMWDALYEGHGWIRIDRRFIELSRAAGSLRFSFRSNPPYVGIQKTPVCHIWRRRRSSRLGRRQYLRSMNESQTMSRTDKKTADLSFFQCGYCGRAVTPPESGSRQRNHCPACLRSSHLDIHIGDRLSGCRGIMDPIGIWVKNDGEWALIHRCRKCGFIRANRVAADDNEALLFAMAVMPLSRLPFPADRTLGLLLNGEAAGVSS